MARQNCTVLGIAASLEIYDSKTVLDTTLNGTNSWYDAQYDTLTSCPLAPCVGSGDRKGTIAAVNFDGDLLCVAALSCPCICSVVLPSLAHRQIKGRFRTNKKMSACAQKTGTFETAKESVLSCFYFYYSDCRTTSSIRCFGVSSLLSPRKESAPSYFFWEFDLTRNIQVL